MKRDALIYKNPLSELKCVKSARAKLAVRLFLADFVRRMRFFMIISGNAIQNAAWDSRVFPLA